MAHARATAKCSSFLNCRESPKDHDGAGEGRTVTSAAEFQTSSQETNVSPHRVLMPPPRIGAGGDQTDRNSPLLGGLESFTHPAGNDPAIGRVHEDDVVAPVLRQTIHLSGEEVLALGVFSRRAWIQGEVELGVECVVEPQWGAPFGAARREVDLELRANGHAPFRLRIASFSGPARCRAPLPGSQPDTLPKGEGAFAAWPEPVLKAILKMIFGRQRNRSPC